MSEYMANKAKGRDSVSDMTNPASDMASDTAGVGKSASNQERFTGKGSRSVSANGGKFDSGNQVRMGGNTKGTGTLKQPTALALAGKDSTKPASADPDGGRDRSGNRRAAGR